MAYGGSCECCGENRIEFLTIEHTDGSGATHRKSSLSARKGGSRLYRELKQLGWPRVFEIADGNFHEVIGIQLLCMNCNASRGYYGYCPHDEPERHLEEFPLPQMSMFEGA